METEWKNERMGHRIRVNLRTEIGRAKGWWNGRVASYITVIGRTISAMVSASSNFLTAVHTQATGKKGNFMGVGHINTRTVMCILDNEKRRRNMGKGRWVSRVVKAMMENTKIIRDTVKGLINEMMGGITLANGNTVKWKGLAWNGTLRATVTKEPGRTIFLTGRVITIGLMVGVLSGTGMRG